MSKMLSEARRTQSEEDSSGSDSGSEVSLEPETDRFGFILTNGSTAGSVGPSPELVRQREAKWISMIGQWDRILLKKSSKVKLRCQKGIPASLRSKCWPLLCGATDRMRQNKNLYESLDSEPGLQSWVDIIERDLDRQFPFHEMFLSKDGHGQRGLFRVLKAYTQFQPEEGYCQAQGPVAAVLLMNMPAEEAFWCLVQVSEQYLPGYYSPLLEGVLFDAAILAWVLKKTCPAAHKHLQQHGVEPLMFATDWLMCLFTRHLPFNTLVRVWDLFFCHGVRVLLQVAVVLVRRVLGRAEQRKECVGQMETLEMLRGVKAHVQDEEDAFIAEVCSVPLSTKDLEKRTEKVLGRWRKDRPSSTFDPRGRCHGFRTAWARARQREEERERKEREKGNLSVPLECSASTLSLSPSLLHKRWKKGGKVNAGDPERGNKVVRHFSMGAKDNWRNWTDLEFKKVQDIHEEEDAQGGHKTKTEFKEKESEEHLEEPKVKNIITEHKEETVTVQQTNKQEESVSKEEESQPGSRTPLEQKEERPANDQTAETVSQPTEVSSLIIQETLNDENRSQSPEEQNPHNNDQDSEVPGTNEETETGENDPTSVENNHSEIQREDPTNAEAELQGSEDSGDEPIKQADTKPEEETENTPEEQVDTAAIAPDTGSETNPDQDQDPETDPQQEHEEAVTETKEDVSGEKRLSDESSVETPEEEAHARMETETQGPVKNAITQDRVDVETTRADTGTETNTEEETQMPPLPESIQQEQDDTETTDAQSDAEELPTNTSRETTEPELIETGICALTKSEETQTPAQMGEETADCVAPAETEETLTQSQELSEESSTPAIASETRAPERPACMVPAGAAEAVENTEKVQENPAGKVSTSAEPAVTDSNKQIHDKDSWAAKDQSQASGRRSSCSSGDVCVRKSSSSKLTRRLSEDLFTTPEKTNQLKEVKTIQTAPDETPTEAQQPDVSKRFGLFRKLKGEQPRKDKKKKPKMQVPKILIQDFSDVTEGERPVEGGVEEQLSSRERRRRRREQERKEKEEERLKRKKEKERKKPQTRGKSFQEEGGKSRDETHPGKTGSQTFRFSASHAESYF